MTEAFDIVPVEGHPFEDLIDGYFPLQVSLADMLARNGFAAACVRLAHAPIMEIPGLPPASPVPLSIDAGRAGLVDRMSALVTASGIRGRASWRWLGGEGAGETLDPMIRLAEPALVDGVGLVSGDLAVEGIGNLSRSQRPDATAWLRCADPVQPVLQSAIEELGWSAAQLWSLDPGGAAILSEASRGAAFRGEVLSVQPELRPQTLPSAAGAHRILLVRHFPDRAAVNVGAS